MSTSRLTLAARLAVRVLAVMTVVFGVLQTLPGCGGKAEAEDDGRSTTPPLDCRQRPELCR